MSCPASNDRSRRGSAEVQRVPRARDGDSRRPPRLGQVHRQSPRTRSNSRSKAAARWSVVRAAENEAEADDRCKTGTRRRQLDPGPWPSRFASGHGTWPRPGAPTCRWQHALGPPLAIRHQKRSWIDNRQATPWPHHIWANKAPAVAGALEEVVDVVRAIREEDQAREWR